MAERKISHKRFCLEIALRPPKFFRGYRFPAEVAAKCSDILDLNEARVSEVNSIGKGAREIVTYQNTGVLQKRIRQRGASLAPSAAAQLRDPLAGGRCGSANDSELLGHAKLADTTSPLEAIDVSRTDEVKHSRRRAKR